VEHTKNKHFESCYNEVLSAQQFDIQYHKKNWGSVREMLFISMLFAFNAVLSIKGIFSKLTKVSEFTPNY